MTNTKQLTTLMKYLTLCLSSVSQNPWHFWAFPAKYSNSATHSNLQNLVSPTPGVEWFLHEMGRYIYIQYLHLLFTYVYVYTYYRIILSNPENQWKSGFRYFDTFHWFTFSRVFLGTTMWRTKTSKNLPHKTILEWVTNTHTIISKKDMTWWILHDWWIAIVNMIPHSLELMLICFCWFLLQSRFIVMSMMSSHPRRIGICGRLPTFVSFAALLPAECTITTQNKNFMQRKTFRTWGFSNSTTVFTSKSSKT